MFFPSSTDTDRKSVNAGLTICRRKAPSGEATTTRLLPAVRHTSLFEPRQRGQRRRRHQRHIDACQRKRRFRLADEAPDPPPCASSTYHVLPTATSVAFARFAWSRRAGPHTVETALAWQIPPDLIALDVKQVQISAGGRRSVTLPQPSLPLTVSGSTRFPSPGTYANACRLSSMISSEFVWSDHAICTGRAAVANPASAPSCRIVSGGALPSIGKRSTRWPSPSRKYAFPPPTPRA